MPRGGGRRPGQASAIVGVVFGAGARRGRRLRGTNDETRNRTLDSPHPLPRGAEEEKGNAREVSDDETLTMSASQKTNNNEVSIERNPKRSYPPCPSWAEPASYLVRLQALRIIGGRGQDARVGVAKDK